MLEFRLLGGGEAWHKLGLDAVRVSTALHHSAHLPETTAVLSDAEHGRALREAVRDGALLTGRRYLLHLHEVEEPLLRGGFVAELQPPVAVHVSRLDGLDLHQRLPQGIPVATRVRLRRAPRRRTRRRLPCAGAARP